MNVSANDARRSQKNMARFYEIDVQPTLLGELTVERHWGRIGAAGQSKTFWFDDEATDIGIAAIERGDFKKFATGADLPAHLKSRRANAR